MNSAKYIEIFKNGQKEGIRDVTVKRKLQTAMWSIYRQLKENRQILS